MPSRPQHFGNAPETKTSFLAFYMKQEQTNKGNSLLLIGIHGLLLEQQLS